MSEKSFPVDEKTILFLKAGRDMEIRGWDRKEVAINGSGKIIEQSADSLHFRFEGNGELSVPAGIEVKVESVGGDLEVYGLTGKIAISHIGGDLEARQVAFMMVEAVGGDAEVYGITDSLFIKRVGGDLEVGDVGILAVETVGGDIAGKGIQSAQLGRAGGDIDLQAGSLGGNMLAGGDIKFGLDGVGSEGARSSAGGDVEIYLGKGANINLDVTSGGKDIRLFVNGQKQQINARHYSSPASEGAPRLEVKAGGDVQISDDPENIRVGWNTNSVPPIPPIPPIPQINIPQINIPPINIPQINIPPINIPGIKISTVSTTEDQKANNVGSETVSATDASSVTEEERIMVLKMLQEKKISLEEAELLLDALDGKATGGEEKENE